MDSQQSNSVTVDKQEDFGLHLSNLQAELKQKTNKRFPFLYSLCCAIDGEGESALLKRIDSIPSDSNSVFTCQESGNYGYSDAIVLGIEEPLPADYEYISDLPNKKSPVIAVKRATASTTRFLSHIAIISPDNKEIVPPEFSMISQTPSGADANLNPRNKGKSIYLCTHYSSKGLRITSLGMISAKARDDDEEEFRIFHTIGGMDAVLGEKSQDSYYLTYNKNWEIILNTPESLVQSIDYTKQSHPDEKKLMESTFSSTLDINSIPDNLPINSVHSDVPNSIPDSIPDSIPENIKSPGVNAEEKTVHTSDLKISSTVLNVDDIPDGVISNNTPDDELSIPDTEVVLNIDELSNYAKRLHSITRSLLPLLIACHSNDNTLVCSGLEHLYHFINSSPIQLVNSKEDPIVDTLLMFIYDGILASFPLCCSNLANLLIKIVDAFSIVSSSTMCIVLSLLSAIQVELFKLKDHNFQSSYYDQIAMNLQVFMSLIKSRVQLMDHVELPAVSSLSLQEKLVSFAYKLESPGMMDMDVLFIEMKTVCESVSPIENQQNYVMYFLYILSHLRRYGRTFSYQLLQDLLAEEKIRFLHSDRMICVYRFIAIPTLLLSLTVSDVLDTAVLHQVLDIFRVLWRNYREPLISELGIIMKYLENLLQSPDILTVNKLEILRAFSNLFSTTEYLIDAFSNYDNKENTLNPITELIDWCGDFVGQFIEGHQPTAEELRLANESAELLKVITRQVVDASSAVQGVKLVRESPIEETPLYKSTRVRLPSNMAINNDLYGSAISPYGQGVTKEALALAKEKGIKKCIALLVASGVIQRTADDIVQFILMNLSQLDEVELGDYLGSDGGTTDEEIELMNQVRYRFVRSTNWKGMDIDIAIRHFLTRCGFRLPGEAQKIDRYIEAFSQCYWEDNPSQFTDSDVVFMLTFSVILLNSDAHNTNIRKENKMTLDEFLRNNRGIDKGKDLDRNMMTKLYWSIVNNEIKMPNTNEKRVVIELPPLEKEHNALLASTQSHLALLKEYRSSMQGFEKLRAVDVIETMWRCIWLEFAIYLDTVLVKGYLREELLEKSLDMLRFCIMTCWTLSLDVPEMAFLDILKRATSSLKDTTGHELKMEGSKELDIVLHEKKDEVSRIFHLDRLIAFLKDCFIMSLDNKIVDDKLDLFVEGSIEPEEGRKFIYDGMLTKKTHRGKLRTYRFFLFSDILVYAKQSLFNKYKPHLVVKLEDCSLTEIDKNVQPYALIINTNIKNIYLIFRDEKEKLQWSRRLFSAILARIKQQRANDIANGSKTQENGRKYRSGSVYTALQDQPEDNNNSNSSNMSMSSSEMNGLPENLQAALNTAKELFTTVSKDDQDRMTPLHAYYLRILYGDKSKCPNEILAKVSTAVMNKWNEIADMGREALYINFAVELSSQNV